ncbi:single-stranded-DNA-specific exonuclease RecJ [Candidatus Berkelbacteria bacterium]|nr:single-stranded-DNA-specific exonuclease RecJ [Candidatus Berkelbacteria bacterium]
MSSLERHWLAPDRVHADLVRQLLANRSITDEEKFFNPDFERDSHDPFLLTGMDKAILRIQQALSVKEVIAVFGDYDADGIPGTALLVKILRSHQATVIPYIPNREREGYGLNEAALRHLKDQKVALVITVDLGITNRHEVKFATELGLDVIVTDHHHIEAQQLPDKAIALLHPALPGSRYPFANLAGGGVAWKLTQALQRTTGIPSLAQLKWWFELPAISTVCDIVPIVDENRMIVHFGMKVLAQTRNEGLRALYKTGGIDSTRLTERVIGFQIGPRLNAPGRIDHAALALELLLTEDSLQAQEIAARIELQNRTRQEQLEAMVNSARQEILQNKYYDQAAIVLLNEHWSIGLIGLAASRLVEQFHRPIILLGAYGKEAKGSGRSIDGFNLFGAIHAQSRFLTSYGGHEKAAGFHLPIKNVNKFKARFIEHARIHLTSDQLLPTLKTDAEIKPDEITNELVTNLMRFAPHGPSNPKPRFIIGPLTIASVKAVGAESQHVKFSFNEGAPNQLEAIGFRLGEKARSYTSHDRIYIVGSLEFNEWNGLDRIQIKADDIKLAQAWEIEQKSSDNLLFDTINKS